VLVVALFRKGLMDCHEMLCVYSGGLRISR